MYLEIYGRYCIFVSSYCTVYLLSCPKVFFLCLWQVEALSILASRELEIIQTTGKELDLLSLFLPRKTALMAVYGRNVYTYLYLLILFKG
jgi:hypothetical protein